MSELTDPQKQISEWLNNPADYSKGLALYEQYGSSAFYKKLLAARVDEYNVGKLKELLLKEVAGVVAVAGVPSPSLSKGEELKPNAGDKKKDNERYLGLIKRKGLLYTELNLLKSKSLFLPDGEQLRKCAVDILSTNQKLMECWAEIDFYQENGNFTSPGLSKGEELKKEKPVEKEIQHLRQSVSKCKRRLKSDSCRDRVGTEKLLAKQTQRLNELLAVRKGVAA